MASSTGRLGGAAPSPCRKVQSKQTAVVHSSRPTAGSSRASRWARTVLAALAFVGLASTSGAAPKDNAALKHDREAMDADYLANNWAGAESKLQRALRECGARGCSTKVRVQLEMHLGIILVNAGKNAEAGAAFANALKLDANAAPDKDFANPDVLKAFEEVKRGASGPATPTPPPPTAAAPPAEPDTTPTTTSDMTHTPVTEQAVGRPVPVYAEGDAPRMVLYYRGAEGDFAKIEMRRTGKTFRAVIPCGQTAAAGTVSYYIITLDAKGDPVGGAGSRGVPYRVAIKARVEGGGPHFPGEKPLAACSGGTPCPAGMNEAGCDKEGKAGALPEGVACSAADVCGEGLLCLEGVCSPRGRFKKNWVSVGASLDVALVAGDEDLCSLANQNDRGSYACFVDGDDPYRGQPQPGKGGALSGVVRPGTLRFLVGYDRMITANFALGARAGYAIRGGPKGFYGSAFLPVHAELRGTYTFGDEPFARRGLHPYAYLAGGVGQVGAEVPNVQVEDDCGYGGRDPCPEGQDRPIVTVSAYRRLGRFFGGAGFGALWLFTPSTGVYADVKASAFFPTFGVAFAPSLGVLQGF
jgi:hypothetical protein